MNVLSTSIDLKKLPLYLRNKIVRIVHSSNKRYKLENQIISFDLSLMIKVSEALKEDQSKFKGF